MLIEGDAGKGGYQLETAPSAFGHLLWSAGGYEVGVVRAGTAEGPGQCPDRSEERGASEKAGLNPAKHTPLPGPA